MKTSYTIYALPVAAAILLLPATAFAAPADGFPWAHWAASMVNFAIFLGILIWFAGPKIQEYFRSRTDQLQADIKEAKQLRAEAREKLDEYSKRLDALDKERQALLDEYHLQGEREKERIIEDAKRQVEKMSADARIVIEQEKRKAKAVLRAQAVDLAVEMAQSKLEGKLDDRAKHTLVSNYVEDLKSMQG